MKSPFLRLALLTAALAPILSLSAQATPPAARTAAARTAGPGMMSAPFDSGALSALSWREIGPYRGGRSVAAAGSSARPSEFWMGTTGGGVFKTSDYGKTWQPVTDNYFGGTIGAIGVAPSNPDIVYVGGGEFPIRGNVSHGDGMWKTTDGGKTWTNIGLNDSRQIAKVRVHPSNPDLVYVAVQGHVWGPNAERGVFRSKDGGRNWEKILFRNDSTGAADLAMDPNNPNVLYAGFWQAYRKPWTLVSGGTGSGLFKSVDGGDTWTEITHNPGLPTGLWGNIGVSVSGGDSRVVYAIIENDEGGVFRSNDAGATWARVNSERKLRQRAWYYTKIYADTKNPDLVYASNVSFQVSRDGGKTWSNVQGIGHGDSHDMWIDPADPSRMIEANDGGANVSLDAGKTWSDQDFATAQFYHVSTTNHFPYQICGAQQDNSTLCGPSRAQGGITYDMWKEAGGGESGFVTALPNNPDIVFAGSYGGLLTRKDMRTGLSRDVNPWPLNPMGHDAQDAKYRMQWTFPIVVSPHDPKTIYVGSSVVFKTTNEGDSYTAISPDLSRNDPRTLGPSGGPITKDQTSVEYYGTVFAIAESPVSKGVIWAGSDDGLIHITRNGGTSWTDITPPLLKEREWSRISIIEASHFNAGTAYVAANRFQMDDNEPYLFKTNDFGKTWKRIDGSGTAHGIPSTEFTRVIREDEVRPGLLFAGTERGIWASLDDGNTWFTLRRNLPIVPVHDIAIKEGDVVLATHGRSFYVMDDIGVLRQLNTAALTQSAHLFTPSPSYRLNWGGGFGGGGSAATPVGKNPPSGAIIYYWLKNPAQRVTVEFRDSTGRTIRSFASDAEQPTQAAGGRRFIAADRPPTHNVGMNTFSWNLRETNATGFPGLIMWGGSLNGPMIPPGNYTVRLLVDGQQASQANLLVRKDPRSNATGADLVAQYKLLMQIRDRTTEANNAVRTVDYVRQQATEKVVEVGSDSARYSALVKGLDEKISAVQGEIYQVKNQSGQDPLNYPIKVNNQIAALAGTVGSTEARPTKQSVEVFNLLTQELDGYLSELRKAYQDLLPAIDEIRQKHGLPKIEVKAVDVPGVRPISEEEEEEEMDKRN